MIGKGEEEEWREYHVDSRREQNRGFKSKGMQLKGLIIIGNIGVSKFTLDSCAVLRHTYRDNNYP